MRVARVVGSVGLLAVAFAVVDLPQVAARLKALDARWVALALTVSVLQTVGSAWRWRYTAQRLGIDLELAAATREYYLAAFLNQVIPGGVVGDVSRAVRHARSGAAKVAPGRRAVHAVVIERLSGQVAVVLVAVASLGALAGRTSGQGGAGASGATGVPGAMGAAAAVIATAMLGALLLGPVRRRVARVTDAQPLRRDLAAGLLARGVFTVQLLGSLAIVASYVVTYLLAARAIGIETSSLTLLPLVTPVLLSMLLPVSIAGWGVREAAAGAIWGAVGLASTDGVAISLAYGLIVLVGTLPGAVMLLRSGLGVRTAREGPGRTAGRVPTAGAEPEDGAPPPASRSSGA